MFTGPPPFAHWIWGIKNRCFIYVDMKVDDGTESPNGLRMTGHGALLVQDRKPINAG